MVYQPEASAAAAARRRRSQRRVGFADQPPPSPDPTFPPPALDIDEDETDAVSAMDDGRPLEAPDGEQLEIQIDAAQTPKVSKQHIAFGESYESARPWNPRNTSHRRNPDPGPSHRRAHL